MLVILVHEFQSSLTLNFVPKTMPNSGSEEALISFPMETFIPLLAAASKCPSIDTSWLRLLTHKSKLVHESEQGCGRKGRLDRRSVMCFPRHKTMKTIMETRGDMIPRQVCIFARWIYWEIQAVAMKPLDRCGVNPYYSCVRWNA